MLTIKPVSEAAQVKSLEPSRNPAESALAELAPGRSIRAEVLQGGTGNTLLRWGDVEFAADTQVRLHAGQKLNLLVTDTSSQIRLKILGNLPRTLQHHWPLLVEKNLLPRILEHLSAHPELLQQPLSNQARQTLTAFNASPSGLADANAEDMAWLLSLLGMEAPGTGAKEDKKTLGGVLREVLEGIKEPESDLGRRLEAVLNGLGKNIFPDQVEKDNGAFFTFLPLPFLEKGFLVYERGCADEPGEEPEPWRLSLYLETSSLGEMRIDFLEHDNGLLLKFVSDSHAVRSFLESCAGDLKKAFSALPLRNLSFESAASPPGNALLKRLAGGEDSMLETWA